MIRLGPVFGETRAGGVGGTLAAASRWRVLAREVAKESVGRVQDRQSYRNAYCRCFHDAFLDAQAEYAPGLVHGDGQHKCDGR